MLADLLHPAQQIVHVDAGRDQLPSHLLGVVEIGFVGVVPGVADLMEEAEVVDLVLIEALEGIVERLGRRHQVFPGELARFQGKACARGDTQGQQAESLQGLLHDHHPACHRRTVMPSASVKR